MGAKIGQAIPNLKTFVQPSNETGNISTEIELNGFIPGDYFLDAWIGPHYNETYDWPKECIEFSIIDSPQKGRTFPHSSNHGFLVPASKNI